VGCKFNKEVSTTSPLSQSGSSENATKRSRPNRDRQKECGSWTTAEQIRGQPDKKIWIQYAILIARHSYQEGIAGETDTNPPGRPKECPPSPRKGFQGPDWGGV
jgi:hypothetical protein